MCAGARPGHTPDCYWCASGDLVVMPDRPHRYAVCDGASDQWRGCPVVATGHELGVKHPE